jgi:hypothetical protein
VCFRNSELLSGRLGKVTLGSGNKAGLFYALSSDYSPDVAANAMNRLAKLSARWLGTRGFSIGIADVTPDHRLIKEKERQVGCACLRACLARRLRLPIPTQVDATTPSRSMKAMLNVSD